jgi:hypothetical protein
MPKNEEFYPAAVRAALGESSIEEELGLDEHTISEDVFDACLLFGLSILN